jgi:hypothetical protein
MMDLDILACLVMILVTFVALSAVLYLTRPRCPECGSLKIAVISKEPLSMRDTSYHAGGGGGGYSQTQIIYNVKKRCSQCGEKWQVILSETR